LIDVYVIHRMLQTLDVHVYILRDMGQGIEMINETSLHLSDMQPHCNGLPLVVRTPLELVVYGNETKVKNHVTLSSLPVYMHSAAF